MARLQDPVRSGALSTWLLALATLLCAGCVSTGTTRGESTGTTRGESTAAATAAAAVWISPGARPAPDTDEAGLWMIMDEAEEQIATSGRTVTEPALNRAVRDTVCRLAPAHCEDIRFYIVRSPDFNASMAPNGFMQIWTGLLLRAENEDQLAFVLGHELTHYLERHTLERWRDLRSKADALVLAQVLTAAVGVGYAGSVAQIVAIGSILAFSRDQERDADHGGFALLRGAGYDPREAARIWQALIEEQQASKEPGTVGFLSTHPSSQERAQTLEQLAAESTPAPAPDAGARRAAYAALVGPYRAEWFRDELRSRDFARSQVLLERLARIGVPAGEAAFLQGELHRLRNDDGDVDKALAAYRRAVEHDDAPAQAWLQLGLLHRRAEQSAQAREALREYLARRPDAPDRKMVEAYIDEHD